MTVEEVRQAIVELKDDGMSDEDILSSLGAAFKEGKFPKDALEAVCEVMGKKVKPEFHNASEEEAKNMVFASEDDEGTGEEAPEAPEAPEADEETSEEDEKKKAFGLMNLI